MATGEKRERDVADVSGGGGNERPGCGSIGSRGLVGHECLLSQWSFDVQRYAIDVQPASRKSATSVACSCGASGPP